MAALLDIAMDHKPLPCDRDDKHAGRVATKATAYWDTLVDFLSKKAQTTKLNVISLEHEWDVMRRGIMSRGQPCAFCRAGLDAALYAVDTIAEERGLFGKSLGGVRSSDLAIAASAAAAAAAAAVARDGDEAAAPGRV